MNFKLISRDADRRVPGSIPARKDRARWKLKWLGCRPVHTGPLSDGPAVRLAGPNQAMQAAPHANMRSIRMTPPRPEKVETGAPAIRRNFITPIWSGRLRKEGRYSVVVFALTSARHG